MARIDELRALFGAGAAPDALTGFDLRLDLADLILGGLDRRGWSQRQLAEAAGMKESFVSRIVHADSNCTLDVAARLLAALDLHVQLVESPAVAPGEPATQAVGPYAVESKDTTNEAITTQAEEAAGDHAFAGGPRAQTS